MDKNIKILFFDAIKNNDVETIKKLLVDGLNINKNFIDKRNNNGYAPLHWSVINDNFFITKLLIENNADLNIRDNNKKTPLHLACQKNNLEITKLLVDKGADVNVKEIGGNTPIIKMALNNNVEAVEYLIKNGANVNICNKYKSTPLYWAIAFRNFKMIKLLIENGADIKIWNRYEKSPLFYVLDKNANNEIAKYLIEKGNYVMTDDDIKLIIEKNVIDILDKKYVNKLLKAL